MLRQPRFLDVLLGNEPRKSGWMRVEVVGDPGPWRQQGSLGRGRWDADLDAEEFDAPTPVLWTRGPLIRCRITNGEYAYFTTWCPHGKSIDTQVRVEGTRWRIAEGFETAENELGLDHNEIRSCHGWRRLDVSSDSSPSMVDFSGRSHQGNAGRVLGRRGSISRAHRNIKGSGGGYAWRDRVPVPPGSRQAVPARSTAWSGTQSPRISSPEQTRECRYDRS